MFGELNKKIAKLRLLLQYNLEAVLFSLRITNSDYPDKST